MDKLKMAPCGIDCNECDSYKVTATQDINEAEGLVEWYRNMGWIGENEGAEAVLAKNPLCKGCWNHTDDCFFTCKCVIRSCCLEKKINHCGECVCFPCENYLEWTCEQELHEKAMEHLMSL